MPPMQSLRIGEDEIGGGGAFGSLISPMMSPTNGPGVSDVALLTASSVGMGARTLPLIKTREKRNMGGLLPKRSSVRTRHDQSVDFRRIHNPDDIPKNFRTVIQQKNNLRATAAASSTSSSAGAASRGFDSILPG